jgi:hypothetical protein
MTLVIALMPGILAARDASGLGLQFGARMLDLGLTIISL